MFTLGTDKYEKGVVVNTAIAMGVVKNVPLRAPFVKILRGLHC